MPSPDRRYSPQEFAALLAAAKARAAATRNEAIDAFGAAAVAAVRRHVRGVRAGWLTAYRALATRARGAAAHPG